MTQGLRAAKQRRQRAEIIANAIALLRAGGADAPIRVRDIAARAGISEATFFNYFESKDAALREWAESLVDASLVAAAECHESGIALRRAVRGLADDLVRSVAEEGEPFLRGLALLRVQPCSAEPARGRVVEKDGALRLVEAGVARGELRGDVPPEALAVTLRAAVVAALVAGARAEAPAPPELVARVRGAADVVLDGMRKRNERVRAPVRAPRGARPGPGGPDLPPA